MMEDTELVLDDQLDAFNDETFGDDGQEYTWEGAEPLSNVFDSGQDNRRESEKLTSRNAHAPVADPEYYDYEDGGYINVEESISRLMLDDDIDESENEHDRFIKASHKSLMPPQVINRNLNWLNDNDMGTPLFSSSVWSMHPTDVLQTRRQEPASTVVLSKPAVDFNHPAVTKEQSPNRPPPGLVQKATVFRTLQDIEKEMLLAASTQKLTTKIIESNYNVPIASVGRQLGESPVTKDFEDSRGTDTPQMNPGLLMRPPLIIMPGHPRRGGFGRGQGMYRSPPHGAQRCAYDQRPLMPPMRPGLHGPFPSGMHGYQQRVGSNYDYIGNHSQGNFPSMQFVRMRAQPMARSQGSKNELNGSDSFAGLMCEKDKQRLKNIQMLQLENDHPYTTDYYYQMKQYEKDGKIVHLAKLFPSSAEFRQRNPYEPARFENALGKLQAVSALAPKRIIDTYLQVHSTTVHGPNHMTRILLGIEAVYKFYLDLQEIKLRKVAHSIDDRVNPRMEFLAFSNILQALDQQGDKLTGWMNFKKGRSLLHKLTVEFNNYEKGRNAAYMILTSFIKHLNTRIMKKMEDGKEDITVGRFLEDFVNKADVVQVDLLLQGIQDKLWKASFGCTLFLLILQRASYHVLEKGISIPWKNYEYSLVNSKTIPMINSKPDDILIGFRRLPCAIRAFLDTNIDGISTPLPFADIKGTQILGLVSQSGIPDIQQKTMSVYHEFSYRGSMKQVL